MFISNSTQSVKRKSIRSETQKQGGRKKGVANLRKADLMADIFNYSADDPKKRGDARVFLSRSAQALTEEFRLSVNGFLKENRNIAKTLERVDLPDGEEELVHPSADLSTRKMGIYWQWMQINRLTDAEGVHTTETSESELLLLEIQKAGKDEEIEQLYLEHEGKLKQVLNNRKKNIPNYYYLVFPETYSFN